MKSRVAVVLVLFLVFLGILLVAWILPGTAISRWQDPLHWNYAFQVVFLLVPAGAIIMLRRHPHIYGLNLSNARRELSVGLIVATCLFLVPLAAAAAFGELELSQKGVRFVVSTLVFQLLFSGFGEELLFRGFFQGELNQVFERRFSAGCTRFGLSVLITSILFGLVHLLNPFNPLQGRFALDVGAGINTFVISLVLCIVRERFNGLIAVSLIHGGADLFSSLYADSVVARVAWGVAFFLACAYLGKVVFEDVSSTPYEAVDANIAEPAASADESR